MTAESVEMHAQYMANILARLGVFCLAALLVLPLAPSVAMAATADPAKLVVGTIDVPPFAVTTSENTWEGFSFDLLDLIASELDLTYQARKFNTTQALLDAVEAGEVDLVPVLVAREETETIMDLTVPYYRSGIAIAIPLNDSGHGWLGFFYALEMGQFFSLVGGLLLLWLLAGAGIWILERKKNREMFGGDPMEGLGHGIWWAAVTMTTVGYGDKSPKTLGGRLIALIWMFTSIVLVSSFTASISASLTAGKIQGKVRGVQDLPRARVGTVAGTAYVEWCRERGIFPVEHPSFKAGLDAVVDGRADAFIFDEAVLKNITVSEYNSLIYVLPDSFEHYYVGMGVRDGSDLRESINRATLKIMAADAWPGLIQRHIPGGG